MQELQGKASKEKENFYDVQSVITKKRKRLTREMCRDISANSAKEKKYERLSSLSRG